MNTESSPDPGGLTEVVKRERARRALSIPAAAQAGGVSHTLWRDWERGAKLTPKMQQAVAATFDWPLSWPERPPTPEAPMDRLDALDAKVDKLIALVHDQIAVLLKDLLLAVQALVDAGQQ